MSDENEKFRTEMRDAVGKLTKNMELVLLEVHLLSRKMELLTDGQRKIEKRLEAGAPSEEQKLCIDEWKGATGAGHYEAESKNERMDKELQGLSEDLHTNVMFSAVQEGRLRDLKYLIEQRDLPVSARNKSGDSLLYVAVQGKSREIINYIMEHVAQLKLDKKECNKILHIACKLGDVDVIKLMRLNNIDFYTLSYGIMPIHVASQHGHLDIIKYMVPQSANLSAQNPGCHSTALHYATEHGHLEIIKYLHQQGVNLSETSTNGYTPLHIASENGHVEIIKYMHVHGVNLSAKDCHWSTPLHEACRYGQVEAVKLLHELGADPKAVSRHKHKPMDLVRLGSATPEQQAAIIAYLKPYS